MTILARAFLNPASRDVRADVADAASLHRTVMRLFPGSEGERARKQRNLLHRLDGDLRRGHLVLLVQSDVQPDFGRLPPTYLLDFHDDFDTAAEIASNPAVRPVGPERERIVAGDRFAFRIRANVTRKVASKVQLQRGKRVPVRGEDARMAWLARKAHDAGFAVQHSEGQDLVLRVTEEPTARGRRGGEVRERALRRPAGGPRSGALPRGAARWHRPREGLRLRVAVDRAEVSMTLEDLALLPRVEDSWSFLYVEHVRIEQEQRSIVLVDRQGRVAVPVAALSVLMLGPGTAITHAAMVALADNGCTVVWVGEGGLRLYAGGHGETRRAGNLLAQARAWADREVHLQVVRRMYTIRFAEPVDEALTLAQVRGMEGVRVREAYAQASRSSGVPWHGRYYNPGEWGGADPVNRALSTANACLYGVCHAAIVATGFSPGLGFVHTGKLLAFVYDVADLYKVEMTVPVAFDAASLDDRAGLEARTRHLCRSRFRDCRLLERIVPDIQRVLALKEEVATFAEHAGAPELAPSELWDPAGDVGGGRNYSPSWDEAEALLADGRHHLADQDGLLDMPRAPEEPDDP